MSWIIHPHFSCPQATKSNHPLVLPLSENDLWFPNGWAWDTTKISMDYEIPAVNDKECEAYYSIYQIFHLKIVLSSMTLSFHMEGLLDRNQKVDWNKNAETWTKVVKSTFEILYNHEFRPAAALLCQYISDRYYPHSQTDQRSIHVTRCVASSDQWVQNIQHNWNWEEYTANWNPKEVETLFRLTPEKLMHAYQAISVEQSFIDPLERWYQLIQFVSSAERKRLKDRALLAETLRSGAFMLRQLYKDLYKKDLPLPNEMTGQIITHIPEQEIRVDSRRYLEFVANDYHLNPQSSLVLFVEGQSEEITIKRLFNEYIGADPGKFGVEVVCLRGVDNITGGKEDRFRAILRLVDYLHFHQTFTFLILDNEGYAQKLKAEARNAKSLYHEKRFITHAEYIKIWRKSFEFDNYSFSEIASAMSIIADGYAKFSSADIKNSQACGTQGDPLSTLYKAKTGYGLNKIRLNKILTEIALSKLARKNLENRAIVKTLHRVLKLACCNHLPIMLETWDKNQSSCYLGKKRKQ